MTLTPIKVRGKGPRKPGFRPPNPNKRLKNAKCKDCGSEEVEVFMRDTAAPIEKLPIEILHQIHLLSQEINFPRASLRIGQQLSHRSFHADLVLQAFSPTWDQWMGVSKEQVSSYYGWFEDGQRFAGDPVLQGRILALPFMNLEIIHLAMDKWARQCKESHHYQHSSDMDPENFHQGGPDEARYSEGVSFQDGGPEFHLVRHDHPTSAFACFQEELTFACVAPDLESPPWRQDLSDRMVFGGGLCSRLEVHPDVRIPDRLITGPFKLDDAMFLFWLMHNNAVVAEDQTWEMAQKGIAAVFDQDDPWIAHLVTCFLYAVGAFKGLPKGVSLLPIDQACKKLQQYKDEPLPLPIWSWKNVVDRLYDYDGTDQEFVVAYIVMYKLGSYRPELSPWREDMQPHSPFITWKR